MSKTNKILIIVGVLVAFGLGWAVGKSTQPVSLPISPQSQPSQTDIEKKLIQDLSQKLAEKQKKGSLPFMVLPGVTKEKMTSLTGEIISKDVQKGILEVKVANSYLGGNFFEWLKEPDYYTKTVKVEKDTEIVKLQPGEKIEPGKPPFEEKKISLTELKEGVRITVRAKTEFNLTAKEPVTAKRIEII